jgi:hypothetical protein
MFFLLRRDFLAGFRDGNLNSVSSRRLTVLKLGGGCNSNEIRFDDHEGWATEARLMILSDAGVVTRGLPLLFRDRKLPNSLILFKPPVTADLETCNMLPILQCDSF